MRVVTMGEMMIRFMPKNYLRLEQATEFEVYYGGDESIVAVSLARFGLESRYITKLPLNPLGQTALNHLRAQGVDTSFIARGGDRLGLNFYESGASVRSPNVLYDRKHSAISEADIEDFDFDKIFQDADWFHVAGITPAISEKTILLTQHAIKAAKKHGLTVSVDLNYRSKLWSSQRAQEVMIPLMQYVDVCIGGREDAEKVLGFKLETEATEDDRLDIDAYKKLCEKLKEAFGFKYIGFTLRESYSASDNAWSAMIYNGSEFYQSKKYNLHLVDRGGGGASFSAGMIYGIMQGMSLPDICEFATAASALKQTVTGDFNLVSFEEVKALMNGDSSGRVKR